MIIVSSLTPAVILLLQIFLLQRINVVTGQVVSASAGDIVLFRCTSNVAEDYPIWSINGVQHSPSDLPLGHWVNSSGLVVQARTELDGTTYRCTSLSVGLLLGGIPTVHSHNSDLFELAVTQSGGNVVHTNYRKGIAVTEIAYNNTTDQLMIDWSRNSSGTYQLYITNCNGSVSLQSPVATCSPASIDGLKRVFGDSEVVIDVRSCDSANKCTFAPPDDAMVQQQTLVQLSMTSTDSLPQDLPAKFFETNNCLLNSKLWSQCSRSGLKLAVSSNTKTVNYTVLTELDGNSKSFLRTEIVNLATGINICPKSTSLSIIQDVFGSVDDLTIQEYCTGSLACGNRLTTLFGDRIKLSITSNTHEDRNQGCTYRAEDILLTDTPTPTLIVPSTTTVASSTMQVRPPVGTVAPTRDPVQPPLLSLGGIVGIAFVILIIIVAVPVIFMIVIGSIQWNKRRKSGNALTAGIRLYEQPKRSAIQRTLPDTPSLPPPSRQSIISDTPISPTYSTYIGRPLMTNGDTKNQPYQLVAFVEGPSVASHSPQGSISYGGHSRNPSGVMPMDRRAQYSIDQTDSECQTPQPQDFVTQMKIPDLNLTEPVRRYVPVDLLPAPLSDSMASTPIPMYDSDGNHIPPRPIAPVPMSIPPLFHNGMVNSLQYDKDRPNSAQQITKAPPYQNPPSYQTPQWSATLPRTTRTAETNEPTLASTSAHSDEDRIWNVV